MSSDGRGSCHPYPYCRRCDIALEKVDQPVGMCRPCIAKMINPNWKFGAPVGGSDEGMSLKHYDGARFMLGDFTKKLK